MDKIEFSNKVIMLRGTLGLTQEEFANMLKVSKRSVSAWESGDVVPKMTVRINMAVTFGLPVSEFLLDDEKAVEKYLMLSQKNDEVMARFLNAKKEINK